MKDYHSTKPMNTKNWKNRLTLMQILTNKHASQLLHMKVEEVLKYCCNKEQMAESLIKILEKTDNEGQVLAMLDSIIKEQNSETTIRSSTKLN